jgi:hypothetical protein
VHDGDDIIDQIIKEAAYPGRGVTQDAPRLVKALSPKGQIGHFIDTNSNPNVVRNDRGNAVIVSESQNVSQVTQDGTASQQLSASKGAQMQSNISQQVPTVTYCD